MSLNTIATADFEAVCTAISGREAQAAGSLVMRDAAELRQLSAEQRAAQPDLQGALDDLAHLAISAASSGLWYGSHKLPHAA